MGTAVEMRDAARKSLRRLWSWLHDASWRIGRNANENQVCPDETIAGQTVGGRAQSPASPVVRRHHAAQGGVLLPFPVRGEALLVRLAELLRSRIADLGFERDQLLLLISRCPGSRLSIDRSAYVEFLADRCMYHVAIEAQPDTRVTVETTDFDTVVQFVVQYVAARRSESVLLEAAS